ncbi:MAG: ornithine carbamoyltransferase [Bacteriovoracaceae bacterium]|nr:ornithine carbamoyltransferase [Bacteriovoracaceae bacterium]
MKKRDFISLLDYSSDELKAMMKLAHEMKAKPDDYTDALRGQILGMIFQKNSTRTRLSFQAGIHQLGGTGFFLSSNDLQLARGETISDTANVLSRYVNAIMIRAMYHNDVEQLAKYASVPVINGLTDYNHPCQVMADMQTIQEKFGHNVEGLKLCYLGDSNNMTVSLICMCAHFGMNMSIVSPEKYALKDQDVIKTKALKIRGDMKLVFTDNVQEGVDGAHVIYTDTWTSMGMEGDRDQKLKDLDYYRVNKKVMGYADSDAIFMHCLPAHRGEEVSPDVIDGSQSVIFDEAENRMHAQKAIMYTLMKN